MRAVIAVVVLALVVSIVVYERESALELVNRLRPHLLLGNGDDCREALRSAGIKFNVVPDSEEGRGCVRRGVISTPALGASFGRSVQLTCRLARDLQHFMTTVVQERSRANLGAEVKTITHFGTYACRDMRGYLSLLSEHAYANAIDVSGFILSDGSQISVKRDWPTTGGKKSIFLHEIAAGACAEFSVVLTPAYNAAHHDHLHFDDGFFGECGID